MQNTPGGFNTPVAIGGQPPFSLQFADDTDLLGCSERELQQLTERLRRGVAGYLFGINYVQSKILLNSYEARPPTNIL